MIVYHGSNIEAKHPEILKPNRELDFGNGFYTTTNLNQAISFARRVTKNRGYGVTDGTIRPAWELRHEVTFDADGGTFAGGEERTTLSMNHGAAYGGRTVKDATYYIDAVGMSDSAQNSSQQGVIVLNWSGEFKPAATIETLDEGASEADVRMQTAWFADANFDGAIGGSVEKWNDFVEWANGTASRAFLRVKGDWRPLWR